MVMAHDKLLQSSSFGPFCNQKQLTRPSYNGIHATELVLPTHSFILLARLQCHMFLGFLGEQRLSQDWYLMVLLRSFVLEQTDLGGGQRFLSQSRCLRSLSLGNTAFTDTRRDDSPLRMEAMLQLPVPSPRDGSSPKVQFPNVCSKAELGVPRKSPGFQIQGNAQPTVGAPPAQRIYRKCEVFLVFCYFFAFLRLLT